MNFNVDICIEEQIKKTRDQQRTCKPGEPFCCVCGKFAEYICSVTDDDICSLECKNTNLASLSLKARPRQAESVDSFLTGQLLQNIDFPLTKGFLSLLPSVLYCKDLVLISKSPSRDKFLLIPLIQRLQKTKKVLLILTSSNPEAISLLQIFQKYSKGIPKFKVRALINAKPLPVELFEAKNNSKVLIGTITRCLKALKAERLQVDYLWICNLTKIIQKCGPAKVRPGQVYEVFKRIEKVEDFSAVWNRKRLDVVFVSDQEEEVLTQVTVLRLVQSPGVFKFEDFVMDVKNEIPSLLFFRCRNRIRTLKWVLKENPGIEGKSVFVFTKNFMSKVRKALKSSEFQERINKSLFFAGVISQDIDYLINVEYPGLVDFQNQLNSLSKDSTILTLISDENQKDLTILKYFLKNFTEVNFPSLDLKNPYNPHQ